MHTATIRRSLATSAWLGLLLVGCGQTSTTPDAPAFGDAGSGGLPSLAALAGMGGASGSAGVGVPPEPPATVNISGRWAMFLFEDPVGVELVQTGNVLSGQGCAGGTPPLKESSVFGCGEIRGSVHGTGATFNFKVGGTSEQYGADVTVSADAQRMTGRFHAVQDLTWPTGWLRVPDADRWLTVTQPGSEMPLRGHYSLKLVEGSIGNEFETTPSYKLSISPDGIYGDLGSFWHTEVTQPTAEGPWQVGPVSTTDPALPNTMNLTGQGNDYSLTQVRVLTGSGHDYVFNASPVTTQ